MNIENTLQNQPANQINLGANPENEKLPLIASYEELEQRIPEVARMKGFDQRSDFHHLTLDEHTKMLVSNLEQDSAVQGLSERIKNLILLAGSFHDLGKADDAGRQVHPKDPEKRQYVGHEAVSARIIREIAPKYLEIEENEVEIVAQLAGLHASALVLVNNFKNEKQPKGKSLKAYDNLVAKVEEIPLDLSIEEKMDLVIAFNRADLLAGKAVGRVGGVEDIDELRKAMPAIIKAIMGRRAGDNNAGITTIEGAYVYQAPTVFSKEAKPIPNELKTLGRVLRDKITDVADAWDLIQSKKNNEQVLNNILRGKLGLSEEQIMALKEII